MASETPAAPIATPDRTEGVPSASPESPVGQASRGARGRGRGRGRARGERGSGGPRGGHGGARGGARVLRAEDLEDGDERLAQDWNSVTNIKAWAAGVDKEEPKAIVEQSEEKPAESSQPMEPMPAEDDGKTTESDQKRQPQKPKTAYVNRERINTGGMKNEKLSAEELDKVMERMRIANETLRARREEVEADEDSFKADLATETARQKAEREQRNSRVTAERAKERQMKALRSAKSETERKIQENIDSQRAEAAQRKMAKQGGREWDAEKVDWTPRGRGGSRGARGGRGGSSLPAAGRSTTQADAEGGPPEGSGDNSAAKAIGEEKVE